jgi:hypothetical protein
MEKDSCKEAAIVYGAEMLEPMNQLCIHYINNSQLESALVLLRTIQR